MKKIYEYHCYDCCGHDVPPCVYMVDDEESIPRSCPQVLGDMAENCNWELKPDPLEIIAWYKECSDLINGNLKNFHGNYDALSSLTEIYRQSRKDLFNLISKEEL